MFQKENKMKRMRKRKTAKECELKPDVTKQNSVTRKKKVLPQTTFMEESLSDKSTVCC